MLRRRKAEEPITRPSCILSTPLFLAVPDRDTFRMRTLDSEVPLNPCRLVRTGPSVMLATPALSGGGSSVSSADVYLLRQFSVFAAAHPSNSTVQAVDVPFPSVVPLPACWAREGRGSAGHKIRGRPRKTRPRVLQTEAQRAHKSHDQWVGLRVSPEVSPGRIRFGVANDSGLFRS